MYTWPELTTSVVKGTDYIGSCKPKCHAITTTTAPAPAINILIYNYYANSLHVFIGRSFVSKKANILFLSLIVIFDWFIIYINVNLETKKWHSGNSYIMAAGRRPWIWFFVSFRNFFSDSTIFFQNSTLGYMTKTLNQIIFFSSSTKIRIFFSATLEIKIFF